MKLYHGSIVTVKKPSLRQGRPNTDYGKGFYTTVDFDQAARWARTMYYGVLSKKRGISVDKKD